MTKQEEREFDEWMKDRNLHHRGLDACFNDAVAVYWVKDFISNLTKKREIKLIEEVERLVEGMTSRFEDTMDVSSIGFPDGGIYTPDYKKGFHQALSSLEENLKKLKGK